MSEREEYTFKDGGTLVLTNGEDGITVQIDLGKSVMGTYNDAMKLAKDIGEHLMAYRPQVFWEDGLPEQDRELNKIAIRLRRIYPKYTRIDYLVWMEGGD